MKIKRSEFFFEKIIKLGVYTVYIEGEDKLTVIITKNNCPKILFSYETLLKNPKSPKNKFYEIDFKCENKNGVFTVFLFSPREKTPIVRLPINFIDTITDGAENNFNLIPEELNLSCFLDLRDTNRSISGWTQIETISEIGLFSGSTFFPYNYCDTEILSAWSTLKNNGIRSSEKSESTLSAQFVEIINKQVKDNIEAYQRKLARAQARAAHIPSEKDKPVFLFAEGAYSKAITVEGKVIYDSYGSREETDIEGHIGDMKKDMAWNYWQYRVVVAKKDNPEVISFIEKIVSLENYIDENTKLFLKAVQEKWLGKLQYSPHWEIIAAD